MDMATDLSRITTTTMARISLLVDLDPRVTRVETKATTTGRTTTDRLRTLLTFLSQMLPLKLKQAPLSLSLPLKVALRYHLPTPIL